MLDGEQNLRCDSVDCVSTQWDRGISAIWFTIFSSYLHSVISAIWFSIFSSLYPARSTFLSQLNSSEPICAIIVWSDLNSVIIWGTLSFDITLKCWTFNAQRNGHCIAKLDGMFWKWLEQGQGLLIILLWSINYSAASKGHKTRSKYWVL